MVIGDPAESVGISFARIKSIKLDDLSGLNARGFVEWLGKNGSGTEISFSPDEEESLGLMGVVEAAKVQIASVHDVNGSGIHEEVVEGIDLVDFAMSYEDQHGNAAS